IGFTKPSRVVSRRDLLDLNRKLQVRDNGPMKFWGVMTVSQAIKIDHALTMLETQGISSLAKYLKKMSGDNTKSSKGLLSDKLVTEAIRIAYKLNEEGYTHPKISKLCEIVSNQLRKDSNSKIIVFANYREMVKEIVSKLSRVDNAKPVEFMGQKEGITQNEQKKRISDFRDGVYNVIATTSVGEEGIDIPEMELAVFYEPVPSEIRLIQRRGRVGRSKLGRIMILMTKNTRDEAYYWTAHRKEKIMKKTLYSMKNGVSNDKQIRDEQRNIGDF
ncbi:MAG: Hef nuclease, partial [Candidatus Aenigmarchaeota archaeon]|nr:Hef nuclease [Candidatus Aenigmarchaeota archaeon]